MSASRKPKTRSLSDLARVEVALSRALNEALGLHMRLGHDVPEWQDGHVVWLQPAKLLKNGHNGSRKHGATSKHGQRIRSRKGSRRSPP